MEKLFEALGGGCLIIERAGDLSRESVEKLSRLMEQETGGLLVILEDTLAYLKESQEEIDPLTEKTYEYFKKCIGHEREEDEEDELKWL